eukprot:jgi/Psemu1/35093/gm1.35093_g
MALPQHEQDQQRQQQQQHSTDSTSQQPNSPLNVKEQLEATANRIWSSVTMKKDGTNASEAIKVPGVPVGLFSQRNNGAEEEDRRRFATTTTTATTATAHPPNPFQQVITTMFSSCTAMGAQCSDNDTEKIRRFQTKGTGVADPEPVTPPPSLEKRTQPPRQASPARIALRETKKHLFKNNHEIAEEAIKHLRQQQQHKRETKPPDVATATNDSTVHDESEVAVDLERDCSQRSAMRSSTISATPNAKLPPSRMPSGAAPVRPRQELSFFPASKPRDPPGTKRQVRRAREKKDRIKGVPKEVQKDGPSRFFRKRGKQHQQHQQQKDALAWEGTERDDSPFSRSWDIDNDGVSDITQTTVDRMAFAVEQQVLVFPEEAENLHRIHSDLTDPAPNRGPAESEKEPAKAAEAEDAAKASAQQQDFFPVLGAVPGFDAAAKHDDFRRVVTPPRGGHSPQKYLSPPSFTRNVGSSGTRSFFTKTTHSTQTSNFASAWRKDEQQFWDTEVAREEGRGDKNGRKTRGKMLSLSPGGKSWGMHKTRRSGATATTTTSITTATTPSPETRINRHQPHEDHTDREVTFTDHDRLMDNLIRQQEVEMAEI